MRLMARTTVDIDPAALDAARTALGTAGVSATVNAALREVARRSAVADFRVERDIDGTPPEVEVGREDRATTAFAPTPPEAA
jgi:Arc/MetJ family transcription regulator